MRFFASLAIAALALLTLASVTQAQADFPAWAYASTATPAPAGGAPEPAAPSTALLRVPGSSRSFTLAQIGQGADWFPEDHPAMPDIVASGRPLAVRQCSFCHYPNGKGRSSNGPVTGLPVAYFLQQIDDFKNDLRTHADPKKNNVNQMIGFAKALTPDEARAAAEYFGSMPWTKWVRVVEADRVPKTKVEGFIYYRLPGTETEPIGMRIVEMPEDTEQTEPLRNSRSGFVAYAPTGSIRRGADLVMTGSRGRTVQCGICHGPDLKGLGPVPGIAGRSPSYLVRQMSDIQAGTRRGRWSPLMKGVVDKLTNEDYVAIAAYVSSR